MTKRHLYLGLLTLGLGACADAAGRDAAKTTGNTPADKPGSIFASSRTLAAGTTVEVTMRDSMSSRRNTLGNPIDAAVTRDVLDAKGRVVIPAGSPVSLHISAISPSKAGDRDGEGTLELTVTSLRVNGVSHSVTAVVRNIPHTMKGRGVTKGVAEDVAVGTVVGAVAGQVIGKNTKSTVVGGAVGAVAGGAVAVAGAQRDIVVGPGTHITFALPATMKIASK